MKLQKKFDVDNLIQKEEPTPLDKIMKQMEEKNKQLSPLKIEKRKPKASFSIESICTLHFDKSLYMLPFPRDVKIPKYNKYDGSGEPCDHIRQLYALNMECMHDHTYLMRLFPRSLSGQVMEWITKISPPLKSFDELLKIFIQHYSYKTKHVRTMIDLCIIK